MENPPASSSPPLLLTVTETARLLSLSVRTVDEFIAAGVIRSVRINRSRRISRAALERFVAELEAGGGR